MDAAETFGISKGKLALFWPKAPYLIWAPHALEKTGLKAADFLKVAWRQFCQISVGFFVPPKSSPESTFEYEMKDP